jgi:hypothetical protein
VILAVLFIDIFATYSVIGVNFSAKLAQKRQFCARMRTRQHENHVKTPGFTHLNALFWQLLRVLLLPNLYTRPKGGGFVHRDWVNLGWMHLDYGPSVQNPAWGLGYDIWVTSQKTKNNRW